jgi:hypothetical protein
LRPFVARAAHALAAAAPPPTVADTKRKFVEAYRFPVPAVYGNVLQELLVAQHLARYNVNYAYSAVRGARCCKAVTQRDAKRTGRTRRKAA